MSITEAKRHYYLKLIIRKFFEEHYGEPIDLFCAEKLRIRIESGPNHNNEFKIKLVNGKIFIYHLDEEICSIG